MAKIKLFRLFFLVSIFSGMMACNYEEEVSSLTIDQAASAVRPTEPEIDFSMDFPSFPWEVMYVLQREYFHKKIAGITESEYLEHRLVELYPETAYKGMFTSFQDKLNAYKQKYAAYETQLCDYEEKMGIGNSFFEEPIPSSFGSIDELQLEAGLRSDEIDLLLPLEAMAKADVLSSRRDFSSFLNARTEVAPAVLIGLGAIAAGLGYSAYFGTLSQDRANEKTDEYYPTRVAGDRSDAFRHVFVSMHLRRFITKGGAKLVMERWERNNPNPYPGDTEMDLHNNIIGRDTRYNSFRGTYFSGWETWASKVRGYINGVATNGLPMDLYEGWDGSSIPSSRAEAKSDIKTRPLSRSRYAYYGNTRYASPCWGVSCIQGYTCNLQTGRCVFDPNFDNCNNCRPAEICENGICRPL